jgi:hypothetical protein
VVKIIHLKIHKSRKLFFHFASRKKDFFFLFVALIGILETMKEGVLASHHLMFALRGKQAKNRKKKSRKKWKYYHMLALNTS